MTAETRLHRRENGRYYLKAWVPEDVRGAIPGGRGGQKWIALGTSDAGEAKRLIRIKSVEFDQEIEAARRRRRGEEDTVSQVEADRLAAVWLNWVLDEDEEGRREGLNEREFRQKVEASEIVDMGASQALARGDASTLDVEVEEVLRHHGLNVRPGSEAWNRLGYAMLKAQKRWAVAVSQRNKGEVVDTPSLPKAADAKRIFTVEDLIQAYLDNPAKKRTAGTLKTYNTVFRAMRELLGPETPVDSIHPVDCERIRGVLLRLPKNAKTRFPDLPLEEAAKVADAEGLERVGTGTVNNYLHNLSALFKWGVKTWRVTRNPAEGLALDEEGSDKSPRHPFSLEQLKAIFNAPLYRGCRDDEEGYAKPGPNVIRRGRFWVPLISLWTGMRLGECCQLRVADIQEHDGVPCIFISETDEPGADEADRKRVKTDAGERYVPVHPELQRIGFLTFVAEMQRKSERRLFPEIKPDTLGYLSGTFSKWFNDKRRFLGKLDIDREKVSFHSFRHNYRDALREAEISLERVRALGGWKRDSDGEEAVYGKGLKARTLYEEIKKVRYPGLDLSHLFAR